MLEPEIREYIYAAGKEPQLREVVVAGTVRSGEIAGLVTGTKARKSWTLDHLGVCLDAGVPWLGNEIPEPKRTIICDAELHAQTLDNRLHKISEAVLELGGRLGRPSSMCLRGASMTLEALLERVGNHSKKFEAIILDPLYRLIGEYDESKPGDMRTVFNIMDKFVTQTGSVIAFSHHATKGDQSKKRATDIGSGSGVLARSCDSWLVMRQHRQADCMVLERVQRSFAPVAPQVIRWRAPLWRLDSETDPTDVATPNTPLPQVEALGLRTVVEGIRAGNKSVESLRRYLGQAEGLKKASAERVKRYAEEAVRQGLCRLESAGGRTEFVSI
ncbi:hypothetical protein AYO47_03910 [Planctomyces sp. SCGC AG-212-M04]|nr:hypothetical protein AYO47_03910 [Planctomyces sp. SCGC AG-212-M04]